MVVSGGDTGTEAGPAHLRLPLTPVASSLLSLQMQRCWGHPIRSWRPPWASPASVRGDAAQGPGGWLVERGRSRGARQPQVGLCFSLCFLNFQGRRLGLSISKLCLSKREELLWRGAGKSWVRSASVVGSCILKHLLICSLREVFEVSRTGSVEKKPEMQFCSRKAALHSLGLDEQ